MWLSTMIRVGTSLVRRNVVDRACATSAVSLASPTAARSSHRPGSAPPTSSLKARSVWPSMVTSVVVVDPAQVAELEMAGERRRLAGHAFHHVAVAAQRVDVVVEDRESRAG